MGVKAKGGLVTVDVKATMQSGDPPGITASYVNDHNLDNSSILTVLPNIGYSSQSLAVVFLRQRNPVDLTWSLHKVEFFVSDSGRRASLWADTVYENVTFP